MWTVILKHIPLCSLIVRNKGKQLPIETSELSRQRRKTSQNNSSSNNKSKGLIFRVHVNVEPLREDGESRVLTRSIGGFEGEQRWTRQVFATNVSGLNSTLLCTQSGKADWTMLSRNMVGFAPSFMDNLKEQVSTRGMELALTGVDFYVFEHLPADDLKLNFSQRRRQCLNSAFKCVALHKGAASCFTFCIIKIISAMTAQMTWHPCEYNVMLIWCFLPPTWVLWLV